MIVAVLAGGRGRRLGGAKPVASFAGAPLIARYEVSWLPALRPALPAEAPLRATLEALAPAAFELDDGRPVSNVNTPEELAAAERA